MSPAWPATRPSLLIRLGDVGDADAWRYFVATYGPIVHRWCVRSGLQDSDASDVTESVFVSVALASSRFRYDPRRGRYRSWLFTVTQRKLCSFFAAARRRIGLVAPAVLDSRAARPPAGDQDHEQLRRRFHRAVLQVRPGLRPQTWRAFWLSAVEGQDPREVASELQISVGAVYVAKCRVLRRLRRAAARGGAE